MPLCRTVPLSLCIDRAGVCHGRRVLVWVAASDAVTHCLAAGAVQLSRGSKKLGSVDTAVAIARRAGVAGRYVVQSVVNVLQDRICRGHLHP